MNWKCKFVIEDELSAGCGTNCCCACCPNRNGCEEICTYVAGGSITKPEDCSDAIAVKDELEEFKASNTPAIVDIHKALVEIKKLEEKKKAISEQLAKAMEKFNIKKFENELVSITYIAETTRVSIDTKALKEKHPDIASELTKIQKVKASVRITLKGD